MNTYTFLTSLSSTGSPSGTASIPAQDQQSAAYRMPHHDLIPLHTVADRNGRINEGN